MEQIKENAAKLIEKLDSKDFNIYFFTLDTKGNPTAGIANIYEMVKILNELGYKAHILHEEVDYTGVGEWLGEEYMVLPHVAIKAQNHNITNSDIIVIPEVFANVMEQWSKIPAKKVVLCQSYDYIFELLNIGATWGMYGITDVITTSEVQANYIKTIFPNITTHVIPVSIPEYFKASDKPKKPIVSICSRDQKDAVKIVKSFYLQYPMYKWVSFRDLRGINKKAFATALGESCLSVWVDEISGFGTFPIESIECDTPVIGVAPKLLPEWMVNTNESGEILLRGNGVWASSTLQIPDLIASFLARFLEDNMPNDLLDEMAKSKGLYTYENQKNKTEVVFGKLVETTKEQINVLLENAIQKQ